MVKSENRPASWDEDDSEKFIDYGNIFVPDRERQYEIICEAIPESTESYNIVNLCCGEGLLDKVILKKFPKHTIYAYDGSRKMIEKAELNLRKYKNRFITRQFNLDDDNWRDFKWKIHAVVSSLSIHHLDDNGKVKLFRDLSKNIVSKGALIISDLIQPTTILGREIAAKDWENSTRERALKINGNLDAYEYFKRVNWNLYADPEPDECDKPSTLLSQLKWLEEAGFISVDVFWMRGGHVIFGGYKP